MLDFMDYALIGDKFLEKNQDVKMTSNQCYMTIWYLVTGSVQKPNVEQEVIHRISQFLEQEGYYVKVSGPRNTAPRLTAFH